MSNATELVPVDSPDVAVMYDLGRGEVTLASGDLVPIRDVVDGDGDSVGVESAALYDELWLVAGPTPTNRYIRFRIRREDHARSLN